MVGDHTLAQRRARPTLEREQPLREAAWVAALEAMERARPVVTASIGGLGEIVRDGVTGVLVPPGEAEPLAEAIVRVASDSALARAMG